jgi:hypothetical protein
MAPTSTRPANIKATLAGSGTLLTPNVARSPVKIVFSCADVRAWSQNRPLSACRQGGDYGAWKVRDFLDSHRRQRAG